MPEKYAAWDELNAMEDPSTALNKQQAKDSQTGKEAKAVQIYRVIEAEGAKIFPDEHGVFYATYKTGKGHVETQRTRDGAFKRFVINRFFDATGRSVSSSQLDDAINLAEAKTNEEPHDVRVRVAGTPDEIFLDLGGNNWKVVRVTKDGWDVLPYDGELCVFRRPDGMLPLPQPDPSGSLEDLRNFVNGSKEEFVKVCGFILACLHPCGPYPALLISGTQGSAKSTLSRFLIALIDNRKTKLSGLPKGEDDLLVTAQHHHLLGFDNISSLTTDMSNALCRIATGSGIQKRKLYTDSGLSSFGGKRPVVLNGIGSLAHRGDLVDRAIFVFLKQIKDQKFLTEEEIKHKWEKAAPKILGGLLKALQGCIRGREGVQLKEISRMADAVKWVEGAAFCGMVPWKEGRFTRLVNESRRKQERAILENDLLAKYIMDRFEQGNTFTTTADELLNILETSNLSVGARKQIPRNARQLHKKLTELEPLFERHGVVFEKRHTEAGNVLVFESQKPMRNKTEECYITQSSEAIGGRITM